MNRPLEYRVRIKVEALDPDTDDSKGGPTVYANLVISRQAILADEYRDKGVQSLVQMLESFNTFDDDGAIE